jgi:HTH-type transcriptional regulator/antitoxin HigA
MRTMQLKPFFNIGPGEFIKEELEYRNWSQEDLAAILGISLKTVNHLINNKQSITLDMARLLGKVFGQSPQYWANLNSNYRLRQNLDDDEINNIQIKSVIYNYMPIKEMITRKWIDNASGDDSLFQSIMNFWEIKTLDFKFLEKSADLHFRKSETFRLYNAYYSLTWYQMARKRAKSIKIGPFYQSRLKQIVSNYSQYTVQKDGIQKVIMELIDSGVKFIVLPHLQKTYIDGASFWEGEHPVIAYSPRYDRVDHFWFTLAHEIAHILYDIKKPDQFVIDDIYAEPTEEKEKKANRFASHILKMEEIKTYFQDYQKYISEFRVRACAKDLSLDEAIVVGALQHHKYLSHRNLNRLKTKVRELIPDAYWIEK